MLVLLLQDFPTVTSTFLLTGSNTDGIPIITQVGRQPQYYVGQGYPRFAVTEGIISAARDTMRGYEAIEKRPTEFLRFRRGLLAWSRATREESFSERLHQFVRALDALTMLEKGQGKSRFVHRCQTFVGAGKKNEGDLDDAYEMRNQIEHLNEWTKALHDRSAAARNWHAIRLLHLVECAARRAYQRVLSTPSLLECFCNDDSSRLFWKRADHELRQAWGKPLSLKAEGPRNPNARGWPARRLPLPEEGMP
jgi:hypothetical protein